MFDLYCEICDRTYLVGPRRLRRFENTDNGPDTTTRDGSLMTRPPSDRTPRRARVEHREPSRGYLPGATNHAPNGSSARSTPMNDPFPPAGSEASTGSGSRSSWEWSSGRSPS